MNSNEVENQNEYIEQYGQEELSNRKIANVISELSTEIDQIDRAIEKIHVNVEKEITLQNPSHDSRVEVLFNLIEQLLMKDNQWSDDERLIIFTEYKTTLDYLLRRLREHHKSQEDRILCLFGGMEEQLREQIKDAFNDPKAQVRILIATDTASEGLNLQSTARYLLRRVNGRSSR